MAAQVGAPRSRPGRMAGTFVFTLTPNGACP